MYQSNSKRHEHDFQDKCKYCQPLYDSFSLYSKGSIKANVTLQFKYLGPEEAIRLAEGLGSGQFLGSNVTVMNCSCEDFGKSSGFLLSQRQ